MNASVAMPISTRTFRNGRSTAVRIPAEFGIKPGEEVVLSQDPDGTVRLAVAVPFASFFAAIERLRVEGHDAAKEPPFRVPRMGPPRDVDLADRGASPAVRKGRVKR